MDDMREAVISAGLDTLYYSGAHRLAAQFFAGEGAILMFHRVRPASAEPFQPNLGLEITPAFLDEILGALTAAGIDIIPMDAVPYRLMTRGHRRRFVALTFDDGSRDNLEHAWPILKRHEAPFTIYTVAAFAEGTGRLWWMAIEKAIRRNDEIEIDLGEGTRTFHCATLEGKRETFATMSRALSSLKSEDDLTPILDELAFGYGVDLAAQCRETCMTWEELARLAADPLVTIGAHTAHHAKLTRLDPTALATEIIEGAHAIKANLGVDPQHFAYPYGSPADAGAREYAMVSGLGFRTAVTTRPGVLFPEHAKHMTALPRISVNGRFQRRRYLDVLLSGAPTALLNRFRRVAAA